MEANTTLLVMGVVAATTTALVAVAVRKLHKRRTAQVRAVSRAWRFESANARNEDGTTTLYSEGIPTRVYSAGTSGYGKGHRPPGEPSHTTIYVAAVGSANPLTDETTRRDTHDCESPSQQNTHDSGDNLS